MGGSRGSKNESGELGSSDLVGGVPFRGGGVRGGVRWGLLFGVVFVGMMR